MYPVASDTESQATVIEPELASVASPCTIARFTAELLELEDDSLLLDELLELDESLPLETGSLEVDDSLELVFALLELSELTDA
ncbi:hypothetical protein QWI17_20830 [Gilvimarinus sp. SDUM040013]|uniref:Uncharacterized protein n=1 Tax=Gilvimarinus gilvus TaxID=3058038 RepID=A0ABU4RY10_9GAMM|nr:hypothetical protein [Gilvimarinus sp. SDUM040013]MDO3388304.1 hypothetical protein [Gilvimarinus sp. SDUM040013]MDX6847854.1 hypothetical protein [Gilvimarinus sp. SDUM040013]